MDTRVHELKFLDGRIEEYSVNVLAENLLTQVGNDGWDGRLLSEIVGVRKDEAAAIPMENGSTITETSLKKKLITTLGWGVNVRWTDQSTSWVPLEKIKEFNPI